ncbi:MAG: CCA tRNA nucleotidyltransferase [Caldisphaera sp.]|jgi:tRNA nucleotidyltransferase (CCA-adding enzyme)|nr:CCA tRNA nucleotidyltransferase [Caldisphaera sp.]
MYDKYDEINKIRKEVLEKIKPSSLQLKILENLSNMIKNKLNSCLRSYNLDAIVEEEGSFAKGTLLNDKWELDMFILIKNVNDSWINSNAKDFLVGCFKDYPIMIKYSQHPYITLLLMGLEADIVPTIYVEKPRENGMGVERTPFHTRYVNRKADGSKKDEIRLLKSFLKGIGIYGAETHIEGFSGYLSELLVLYYGNFLNAIINASNWKNQVFIDIEGNGDFQYLKDKYSTSNIIVVDPVDPKRNAAAAVSNKSLNTFILASKLFLRNPSKVFFHVFSYNKPTKINAPSLLINCYGNYGEVPPEEIWGKLKRFSENIKINSKRYGFNVLKTAIYTDEYKDAYIGLLLENNIISQFELLRGPLIEDDINNIIGFINKRIDEQGIVLIDNDKLLGGRNRKFINIKELIKYLIIKENNLLPKNTKDCRIEEIFDINGFKINGGIKEWLINSLYSMPAWITNM